MFDAKEYDEIVSSINITEDNSQLVIMTNDFHYIFGTPIELEKILNSNYKRCLLVSFYNFHVNTDNSIKGNFNIYIKPSAKGVLGEKTIKEIETVLLDGSERKKFFVQGQRYHANGVQPKASPYALNKSYRIQIEEDLSAGEKVIRIPLTPITMVGDTLFIGAVGLFFVPLMILVAE